MNGRSGDQVTLWEGRLGGRTADEVMAFTVSLPFDQRLAADDLAGSRAHVAGSDEAGSSPTTEASILARPRSTRSRRAPERRASSSEPERRGHPHGDRAAGDRARRRRRAPSSTPGAAATTRWRPTCACTPAGRRWASPADVLALQEVLRRRAGEAGDAYLPGYTHLQRAQPVLLAHHLLAHGWALARDVDRLLRRVARLDVSPLGAGALAGSSLPARPRLRGRRARLRGRASRTPSTPCPTGTSWPRRSSTWRCSGSTCRGSARSSCCGRPRSSASSRLDDRYATGSSMLPQKKNPDVAELARGKAGRLVGHLAGLLATLRACRSPTTGTCRRTRSRCSTPSTRCLRGLPALTGLVRHLDASTSTRMAAAADWPDGRGGRPGRVAGRARDAVPRGARHRRRAGARLARAPRARWPSWSQAHPALGAEALALLEPGVAVTRRTTPGGAGPGPVAEQLERFAHRLEVDRERLDGAVAGTGMRGATSGAASAGAAGSRSAGKGAAASSGA